MTGRIPRRSEARACVMFASGDDYATHVNWRLQMIRRCLASLGAPAAVMAVVSLASVHAGGQAPTAAATTQSARGEDVDVAPHPVGRAGPAGRMEVRRSDALATPQGVRRERVSDGRRSGAAYQGRTRKVSEKLGGRGRTPSPQRIHPRVGCHQQLLAGVGLREKGVQANVTDCGAGWANSVYARDADEGGRPGRGSRGTLPDAVFPSNMAGVRHGRALSHARGARSHAGRCRRGSQSDSAESRLRRDSPGIVRRPSHHPHGRTSAWKHPHVAWRLDRPLGGRYAGRRDHQFRRQVALQVGLGHPLANGDPDVALRRTLHARRRGHDRLPVHARGSGEIYQTLDSRGSPHKAFGTPSGVGVSRGELRLNQHA